MKATRASTSAWPACSASSSSSAWVVFLRERVSTRTARSIERMSSADFPLRSSPMRFTPMQAGLIPTVMQNGSASIVITE